MHLEHAPIELATLGAHGMRFLRHTAVACFASAVADDFCSQSLVLPEALDVWASRREDKGPQLLSLVLDAYIEGFGRRVGAGAIGWAHLFEPFQRCPLPFIAAEVAHGLRQQGFARQVRLARARELATSWRLWSDWNQEESLLSEELQSRKLESCSLLKSWPHLDFLANASTSFSSLLGCLQPQGQDVPQRPLLSSVGHSFPDFWRMLADELFMTPTLQMPWGNGGAPYVLAKVLWQLRHEDQGIRGRPMYLEFGVFEGASINFIARKLRSMDPGALVFGFDSFRGLPEAWRSNSDVPGGLTFASGSFALEKEPEVEGNVRLVRGWFNETLPAFLAGLAAGSGNRDPWVQLLHVDCDLYSSALEVLRALAPFFRPRSIIIFDELVNFPHFESQELRALYDFFQDKPWKFRVVAAPWFFLRSTSDLADLFRKEGLSEVNLHQAVAIELSS